MTRKEITFAEFQQRKTDYVSSDFDLNFKPDYLYTAEEADAAAALKSKGSPAASLTWGIDGNRSKASLMPGIEGEKQVAKILDAYVATKQNAYVFHSLSWPDSNGDTDHVIMWNDLMIIIDAKRWKSQRKYSVTPKNTIKRGTVNFPEGRVKIGWAMQAWRRKLEGRVTVKGIICIAQEKVFVTKDGNWYKCPFKVVTAENLIEQIEYMISKHKPKTNGNSVRRYLTRLLVKPRDVFKEISNPESFER